MKLSKDNSSNPEAGRVFFNVTAAVLFFTAGVKLLSSATSARVLDHVDAIFLVPLRIVLSTVSLIEIAIGGALLSSLSPTRKVALVLWFSVSCITYRIGAMWLDSGKPCPCLGSVVQSLGIPEFFAESALWAALIYMLGGGLWKAWQLAKGPGSRRFRLSGCASRAGLNMAIISIVQSVTLAGVTSTAGAQTGKELELLKLHLSAASSDVGSIEFVAEYPGQVSKAPSCIYYNARWRGEEFVLQEADWQCLSQVQPKSGDDAVRFYGITGDEPWHLEQPLGLGERRALTIWATPRRCPPERVFDTNSIKTRFLLPYYCGVFDFAPKITWDGNFFTGHSRIERLVAGKPQIVDEQVSGEVKVDKEMVPSLIRYRYAPMPTNSWRQVEFDYSLGKLRDFFPRQIVYKYISDGVTVATMKWKVHALDSALPDSSTQPFSYLNYYQSNQLYFFAVTNYQLMSLAEGGKWDRVYLPVKRNEGLKRGEILFALLVVSLFLIPFLARKRVSGDEGTNQSNTPS